MFLHLGGDVVIPTRELVAILDVACIERSPNNRDFVRAVGESGRLEQVGDGETNTWVITTKKVYASNISALTLRKRAGFLLYTDEDEA